MIPLRPPKLSHHLVDYATQGATPGYQCSKCGVTGCKLWREYQTFLDLQQLYCAVCAVRDQAGVSDGIGPETRVDEQGKIAWHGYACDQIGWLVPAVPDQYNSTFWGYTSVPQDGVDWWHRLPTYVKGCGDPPRSRRAKRDLWPPGHKGLIFQAFQAFYPMHIILGDE